ncbi:hypothetical protein NP493_135g02026 [Ridgeia piscesae]|uniref:Protein Wnt n=1 Tax=Ridgeia piscesae TaxID=27915 RepID=A0AAD9P548_RIDPI|nr:hypothetical protein NP493_135g02026 [Ridgeia piscesae]
MTGNISKDSQPTPVSDTADTCHGLTDLVAKQLKLCRSHPNAMTRVAFGARLGIMECRHQFHGERWNCSTSGNDTVFSRAYLEQATRETSFIYAASSAGVTYAVTAACTAGNLTDCACDMKRQSKQAAADWKWGGCSDNVRYGMWFSAAFIDPPETLRHRQTRDVRALANLHNNEVGRKTVAKEMRLKCRCHGVSGSCGVKTCWRAMSNFQRIGRALKNRYKMAVALAPRSKRKLRRRDKKRRNEPIGSTEMVYVRKSPNYCKRDIARGVFGTKGRECKKNSRKSDGCNLLCCGRGYNTQTLKLVERCQCKFFWCCHVKCKTCETLIDRHTCK